MRLYIRLGRHRLDAMTYSPADNTLSHTAVSLDPAATSYAGAMRDAIYGNPSLLPDDYDSALILIDRDSRMLLPAAVDDAELQRRLLDMMSDCDGRRARSVIIDTPLAGLDVRMVMSLEADVDNYLHRTYPGCRIMPSLAPLAEYFAAKSRLSGDTQCYVNLRDDCDATIDIVVMRSGMPLLVNSYQAPDDADALYYIMAACEVTHFVTGEESTDVISLCGDRTRRGRLMPMLTARHGRVMPVIFPPAIYRAASDAGALPFDMVAAAIL